MTSSLDNDPRAASWSASAHARSGALLSPDGVHGLGEPVAMPAVGVGGEPLPVGKPSFEQGVCTTCPT